MSWYRENEEVYYTTTRCTCTAVRRKDVSDLKDLAACNERKRVRLCAHPDPDDALHEMLIVHERGAYVRPHCHIGKSESIHVIEGRADLLLYSDSGEVEQTIPLGDYASGLTFYHRLDTPTFHSLVIRSDVFVFHEVTSGPFDRATTVFPSWA